MTNSLHLVLRAADAAARWHVHQRRKGSAAEPYINHLLEVTTLVGEATEGRDSELVAAALLHDAIEDQKIPHERIAELFGNEVAMIVVEVTDDKSLDKSERKRLQVINAHKKSERAKMLKLADKISNLRALAVSPPSDWSIERRLQYIGWARDVAVGLKGVSLRLEEEFEFAATAAERACTLSAKTDTEQWRR